MLAVALSGFNTEQHTQPERTSTMKTTCVNWFFVSTLAAVSMLFLGCGTGNATATGPGGQGDADGYEALMRAGPPGVRGDISDAEREDLLYIREEEKIARSTIFRGAKRDI